MMIIKTMIIAAVILASLPANAFMLMGGRVGNNYSICSTGGKLFDWDCSGTNLTSNVCTKGDTSATLVGEATITDGKVSITDGTANGTDYYTFTMTGNDTFPRGDVTVELTVNMSTITAGAFMISARAAASSYFRIYWATGNDIVVRWNNGTIDRTKTFDLNLSTSTEYQIIVKASAAYGIAISTDGGATYTTDATQTIGTLANDDGSATFSVGNPVDDKAMVGTIDNVRVSHGWRTDI